MALPFCREGLERTLSTREGESLRFQNKRAGSVSPQEAALLLGVLDKNEDQLQTVMHMAASAPESFRNTVALPQKWEEQGVVTAREAA